MSYRILVVDDDISICKLLKIILSRQNYQCTTACDASQARSIIQYNQIDLVLCDIHMPGESGLDLIQFLAAEHPNIATLMVTANIDQKIAEKAFEFGAYGYIVKPFDSHQVMIPIANALHRHHLELKAQARQMRMEETVSNQTRKLTSLNHQIKEKEAALIELASKVDKAHNALQVLIEQQQESRKEREENILANVKDTILPYFDKLKHLRLNADQLKLVAIVEEKLGTLIAPMINLLSSRKYGLTHTELLVADMIKHGKQTKEIAEMLNLSQNTIITHRYHIRRKLGLMNTKINLQVHLQSMEQPAAECVHST